MATVALERDFGWAHAIALVRVNGAGLGANIFQPLSIGHFG